MKNLLFILINIVLMLVIVYYIILRGMQSLSSYGVWKSIYLIFCLISFIFFVFSMLGGSKIPIPIASVVSFVGNSFLVIGAYLLALFLLVDIVRLINLGLHFITDMDKFRFVTFVIGVVIIGIVMGIGNYKFNHPAVVELDLNSSKPNVGKEIKIVALSDVHLGFSINKKHLKKYVNLINEQNPDLVIFGGDLIDRDITPVINQDMDEELKNINAPLGVFTVFGNHEYYGNDMSATRRFFNKSNIKLLTDSAALINDEFYLIGRDDKTNPQRKSLKNITANLEPAKPTILIDHQPYGLYEAEKENIDLQFSGHTHYGQFFPINLIIDKIYEQGYGYLKKGNTHYYVSSGLGIWGPQYRIATQSEIVVIRFTY